MNIDLDKVNFVHLPGGEVHLNAKDFKDALKNALLLTPEPTSEVITLWSPLRNATDIMELLIFTDAIRRSDYKDYELNVIIPYLPYARQDRASNYGESLTSKVFANIINAQKYDSVIAYDPHSDVITALIDNLTVIKMKPVNCVAHTLDGTYILVAPDASQYKRLRKMYPDEPIIYAVKSRNTETGSLTDMKLILDGVDSRRLSDATLLVVDDICDGGATFNLLAKTIRQNGYDNDMVLFVTHGIFSKGFDELKKYYKHIYTTNSFYQGESDDFVTAFFIDI